MTSQGPRLRGRVVDETGRPVAGASIVLWVVDGTGTAPSEPGVERAAEVAVARARKQVPCDLAAGESGEDGRFDLPVAGPWPHASRLSARRDADGETRAASVDVLAPTADGRDVGELRLERLAALRARVTIGRQPIKDAWVRAQVEADPPVALVPAPPGWARTDGDGRAVLPLAAHARWLAWSAGAAGAATVHGEARVSASGCDVEVALVPDAPVRGTVVDAEGRPVAGASVEAHDLTPQLATGVRGYSAALRWARRSGTAASDARGLFELRGLRPGTPHAIHVLGPVEAAPTRVLTAIEPPSSNLVFQLPGAGTSVAVTGAPPGVVVHLQREDAAGWKDWTDVRRSEGDRVDWPLLDAGTWRVVATAPGRAAALSSPIEVEAQAPLRLVLELRHPSRAITGHVVDLGGRPAVGAVVAWRDLPFLNATTGVDGGFRLDGLPQGELRLDVGTPGQARREVTAAAGASDTGRIFLE